MSTTQTQPQLHTQILAAQSTLTHKPYLNYIYIYIYILKSHHVDLPTWPLETNHTQIIENPEDRSYETFAKRAPLSLSH